MFRQNSDPGGTMQRRSRRRRGGGVERHLTFRVGLLLLPNLEVFHPQKAEALKKIQVPVSLSPEEFLDVLKKAFPRLGDTAFDLARVDCRKKIIRINVSPLTPSVLKASRELNRSALYLLPKEPLEEQAEEHNDEDHDSGQSLDLEDNDVQLVSTRSSMVIDEPNSLEGVIDDPNSPEWVIDNPNSPEGVIDDPNSPEGVIDDPNSPRPHTMERDDLLEWRALRATQDEEYLSSLRTDQERDQAQRRETEIENRRKEALERRRFNLSSLDEPQDGTPLQIKYPDGHTVRRRFCLTHPIQHLLDFVGSDDMATEVFYIQKARAPLIRSTTTGRISDYINESCTVFVTWDDVLDTHIDDLLFQENNSPENGSGSRSPGSLDLNHVNDTEPDLKTLLTNLTSKVCIGQTTISNMVNVCRDNILDGAVRAFSRRSFIPETKLSVVFMDDFNQAEGAVDEGGPTREFFRLLMMALKESSLFTGSQNNKILSLDSRALQRGLYRTYGTMIAVAVVHGGLFPSFFSERLYHNLCAIPISSPTLEDVWDLDLQGKLRKISEAGDVTVARDAIVDAAESLSLLGSLGHITTLEERDQLLQAAVTFYVEGRTKEALEQFAEGLNTLGLLDMMKIHPSLFKEAFCFSERPLKATDLMSLFEAELSLPGTNRWRLEKKVQGFWRDFLVDIEDGVFEITLDQLLVFASGADRVPALGFSPQPMLSFIHETERKYPEANTCVVTLKLPVHQTYEQFTKYMCEGIIQAPSFGLA